MPDIELLGAIYPNVPAVDLPKSGGGTARFYDVSGALCTITVEEEDGEVSYISDKTAQEVYDALEVGINPVFRFYDLRDNADAYIYASLSKLESTANGEELTLSSFQTDALTAATASDYFELTIMPPVEKTVSGSLISITDAIGGPVINVTVAINPVQSGSGDPSPTNVRSISGFSAANIVVSPTTTAGDGTTYTVQFGTAGTVYGGTLDVTTGELTVTHRYMLADGVNVKTTGGYGAGGPKWLPCITLSAADYAVWDTMKTSYLKTKPDASFNIQNDENTADFGNSAHVIVLHIGTMQGTDGTHGYNSASEVHAAVNAYLQQNPLQICYELATSTTVQLTQTEVALLTGTNNVWSDTNGNVTLTYMAVDA